MTPDVYAIIEDSVTCVVLLGVPPRTRFYPFGEAPSPAEKPYAVWQMPTSIPANYLGQLPDADDSRVQIDIYAATQVTADEVARAIRAAVEPHAYLLNAAQRPRDAVTRSYGYMLEFQFQTSR